MVKSIFHSKGRDVNTSENGVECGYNGPNWCDDGYNEPNLAKEYQGNFIRWVDGPGFLRAWKVSFDPDGIFYKENFKANVDPDKPGTNCECAWDVIAEATKDGVVTKNQVENVRCS